MAADKWMLRLSVKVLSEKALLGLESEPTFQVGSVLVTAKDSAGYFVLEARDFVTEDEALAYVPYLKTGLWNLAIDRNIAFVPFFERRDITRPDDPEEAARNLEKSFKVPYTGPVHGLTQEAGFSVYQASENILFISMDGGKAYVLTPWKMVEKALSEGIQFGNAGSEKTDPNLTTALDLYLAHFSESSIRAKFLTLMMALEVLAPVTEKHAVAVGMLTDFAATVQVKLNTTIDDEARDALQALHKDIEFRKETSIRRRVRRLILDGTPLPEAERLEWARKVVKAYDLRGSMVHSGTVELKVLSEAHSVALDAVKLILGARLGLETMLTVKSNPSDTHHPKAAPASGESLETERSFIGTTVSSR